MCLKFLGLPVVIKNGPPFILRKIIPAFHSTFVRTKWFQFPVLEDSYSCPVFLNSSVVTAIHLSIFFHLFFPFFRSTLSWAAASVKLLLFCYLFFLFWITAMIRATSIFNRRWFTATGFKIKVSSWIIRIRTVKHFWIY